MKRIFQTACANASNWHALLVLGGIAFVLCTLSLCTSCNVVRTITNKSEFYQRGDTSVVIQTKTIESYDASKK